MRTHEADMWKIHDWRGHCRVEYFHWENYWRWSSLNKALPSCSWLTQIEFLPNKITIKRNWCQPKNSMPLLSYTQTELKNKGESLEHSISNWYHQNNPISISQGQGRNGVATILSANAMLMKPRIQSFIPLKYVTQNPSFIATETQTHQHHCAQKD